MPLDPEAIQWFRKNTPWIKTIAEMEEIDRKMRIFIAERRLKDAKRQLRRYLKK